MPMPGKNALDLYILAQCLQQGSTSCSPEVRMLASGTPAVVLCADMLPEDRVYASTHAIYVIYMDGLLQ